MNKDGYNKISGIRVAYDVCMAGKNRRKQSKDTISTNYSIFWQSWLLKHLTNLMVFRTLEWTLWWSKKAMFLQKDNLTSPNTVSYAFRCIFIFHTDFQHYPLLQSAISQKSWIFSSSLPAYCRKEMICLFEELCICQKNLVLLLTFNVQWDLTWISFYHENI